jgi:hypothetical protein
MTVDTTAGTIVSDPGAGGRSASGSEDWNVVRRHAFVARDECERLYSGLCDEQPIERITVVAR